MKRPKLLFVIACILTASCISSLYSKPIPNRHDDVSTISEEYVRATRGGVFDLTAVIPSKLYHPRDGYISYERIWCLDQEKGTMKDYIELIEDVCEMKSGTMKGEWCVSLKNSLPLFNATIDQNGATCTGGDLTTIIHILEPISSYTASEWLVTAEAFGYRKEPDLSK